MNRHPTRRDLMIGSAATFLAGEGVARAAIADTETPLAAANAAGATFRGRVVEQAGGASDVRPIADVLVSNGREIVRTGGDGRYALPVRDGHGVFVIKPAGFDVPLDPQTRLPRFSYSHDPDGTPASLEFRYGGLPPTGPLPDSVDFSLVRTTAAERFDVLLLTDPQPESVTEITYVRDGIVAGLVGSDARLAIICGDIAFDDLSMYGRITRLFGQIGLPWWVVGGNHDLDYEAPDATRSRDTFKRVFGAPYYAHEHGKALFIMLDNVDFLGRQADRAASPKNYRGRFSDDQLRFVANLLAQTPPDRLLVFVMHIPLTTDIDPNAPGQNTSNTRDLLALIGDRPAVSFAGHTHSTEHHYLGAALGGSDSNPHHHHVLTAASGSWWSGPLDHRGIACADSYDGSPNGYHVLSIDGATYTTRFVPAAEPAGKQMRISLDTGAHANDIEVERRVDEATLLRSPLSRDQLAGTHLVVNLFDGGPRSRLSFTVAGAAPVAMDRVRRSDPFVAQLYGRYPDTIKRWVSPKPSSHVWQARLPSGLTIGAHAVVVTAVDEYGRQHRDSMVLEIT